MTIEDLQVNNGNATKMQLIINVWIESMGTSRCSLNAHYNGKYYVIFLHRLYLLPESEQPKYSRCTIVDKE